MNNINDIINSFDESDYFDNVDLHIHSTCSDGNLSPKEIIQQAEEKGLQYISICDHNTTEAYLLDEVLNSSLIIPAIEFDCWHQGVLIHILGYGINPKNEELLSFCAKNKAGTSSDIVRFFTYRNPRKVIQAIHTAGGISVLAHPACYWTLSLDKFVKSLLKYGLDGIEVFYPYKRHRGIIKFHLAAVVKKIAEKYNLIQTGGSDCHGSHL